MTLYGTTRHEIGDSRVSKWIEDSAPQDDALEIVRLSAARARAVDEAGSVIARQLNGPLTALLLYIGEIKQHSHQLSQSSSDRVYLQQVVENALQQTERVCAMMKQIAATHRRTLRPIRPQGWMGDANRSRQRWYSRAGRDVFIGRRPEAFDEARARGPEPDEPRVLQQAGRAADASAQEPSKVTAPSDAKAWSAKYGGPGPHRALAPRRGVDANCQARCLHGLLSLKRRSDLYLLAVMLRESGGIHYVAAVRAVTAEASLGAAKPAV